MVDCAATGNPTPILTWYKNGIELLTSSNGLIITNTTNGRYAQRILIIPSLTVGDEGAYKCVATNGLTTQSSSLDLDVIGCKIFV